MQFFFSVLFPFLFSLDSLIFSPSLHDYYNYYYYDYGNYYYCYYYSYFSYYLN